MIFRKDDVLSRFLKLPHQKQQLPSFWVYGDYVWRVAVDLQASLPPANAPVWVETLSVQSYLWSADSEQTLGVWSMNLCLPPLHPPRRNSAGESRCKMDMETQQLNPQGEIGKARLGTRVTTQVDGVIITLETVIRQILRGWTWIWELQGEKEPNL